MPREKQRTPELRDHVLQVAVSMLSSGGVSGFTTRKVAQEAETSLPAVYELFGDKAGLVREIFFEGFRLLRKRFELLTETNNPIADLIHTAKTIRLFVSENPTLAEIMFSRPFADFDPGPAELRAGSAVRLFIVARVRRCLQAGLLEGDETDIAHVIVSVTHGLISTEMSGRLGTSKASIERRWGLALQAVLTGLRPKPPVC